MPRTRFPLLAACAHCVFHFRSLETWMPRSRSEEDSSRATRSSVALFNMVRFGAGECLPKCSNLHLSKLSSISQVLAQLTSLLSLVWLSSLSSGGIKSRHHFAIDSKQEELHLGREVIGHVVYENNKYYGAPGFSTLNLSPV